MTERIDTVLDLVHQRGEQGPRGGGEQAPRSVDKVRERYNLRAKDEWNDLPKEVRAGVAEALADQWNGSMGGQGREEADVRKARRDHFRRYAEDPD